MRKTLVLVMILAAFFPAAAGQALAQTEEPLWERIMVRECIREMTELGVAEGEAARLVHRYQFMAMAMKGTTGNEDEEIEAEAVGKALGTALGTALSQRGEEAVTDTAFALMTAVRAGMNPEAAAAAEAQLLRSRYTLRNIVRIMTRAAEMVRTDRLEDAGTGLAVMIQNMARNMVRTETMLTEMAQAGSGTVATAGASGAGSPAGQGMPGNSAHNDAAGSSGPGEGGPGTDAGSGNRSGQSGN
jgi:hypothetical protein